MQESEVEYHKGIESLLDRSFTERRHLMNKHDVSDAEVIASIKLTGEHAIMWRDMVEYCNLSQKLIDKLDSQTIRMFPQLMKNVGPNMVKAIFIKGLKEAHEETMNNIILGQAIAQGKAQIVQVKPEEAGQ